MKVAICLRGAVSKITQRFLYPGSLYDPGNYINYHAVHKSILKHIILPNKNATFDFFIQCWNIDLEKELVELYKPKSWLFEDNNIYKNEITHNLNATNKSLNEFGATSQLLAISKTINIMNDYVDKNNIFYDYVIIYRPDVLLWKDIDLDSYDNNKIYVNAHPGSGGDFHFIMNLSNSYEFSKIYGTTKSNNIVTDTSLHGKIRAFVEHYMNKILHMDNIIPGIHQEVLRKLKIMSIDLHKVQIEQFYQYGLTHDEIQTYIV